MLAWLKQDINTSYKGVLDRENPIKDCTYRNKGEGLR